VVVTIDRRESIFERLVSLAYKPRQLFTLAADGNSYRLPVATHAGPLIVRIPAGIWSPSFDGSTSYDSLRTAHAATYRFEEITIARDAG
jgi:hypothetical protein